MNDEHLCPVCGEEMWIAGLIQDKPFWICDNCDCEEDDD